MLELARTGQSWQLGYGGDTLNTALHLARAGHDVAYLTAVGSDPLSVDLTTRWGEEGLDTSLVLEHPTRSTGLYAISTDALGERSFSYWRDSSAARDLFELEAAPAALARAETAGLLAFSLISLAILPETGRQALLDLARRVRANGGRVAFDGNYRPRLWSSREEAAGWRDAGIIVSDIGLPTLDDETALSDQRDAQSVAAHWQDLGCTETVVKLGAAGARLPDGSIVAPEALLAPVDTSGAGDAFNAGYLGARMKGAGTVPAAQDGNRLAGWTIMRPGAIPPRDS